jgi:hypothetical protein
MTDMTNTTTALCQTADGDAADDTETRQEAALFGMNKAAIFHVLAQARITRAVAIFDGYGDSGQIERIEVYAGDETASLPTVEIEFIEVGSHTGDVNRQSVSIATAIENMAYHAIRQTHCGWENDEGAFGDITFDVAEQTVTLDYNERYTEIENYTHQF